MNKWHQHFMEKAAHAASMSKDTNTKVGACIWDEEEKLEVCCGWNDLARSVVHTTQRNSAPLKYMLTSHAEISCIANAARSGRSTLGKAIAVTMFPCSLCAAAIINAGIKTVVAPEPDFEHKQYGESFKLSLQQFEEAGVEVIYIEASNDLPS